MITTSRRNRSLVAAAVLGLTMALGAVPVGAGTLRTIVVDPSTVVAGGTVTVSGPSDCIEGTTLTVGIPQLELGVDVDADADWETELTIPADTPAGTYLVTAEGAECGYGDATLVVTAASTTTTAAPTTTTTAEVADAAAAAPTFTG